MSNHKTSCSWRIRSIICVRTASSSPGVLYTCTPYAVKVSVMMPPSNEQRRPSSKRVSGSPIMPNSRRSIVAVPGFSLLLAAMIYQCSSYSLAQVSMPSVAFYGPPARSGIARGRFLILAIRVRSNYIQRGAAKDPGTEMVTVAQAARRISSPHSTPLLGRLGRCPLWYIA